MDNFLEANCDKLTRIKCPRCKKEFLFETRAGVKWCACGYSTDDKLSKQVQNAVTKTLAELNKLKG